MTTLCSGRLADLHAEKACHAGNQVRIVLRRQIGPNRDRLCEQPDASRAAGVIAPSSNAGCEWPGCTSNRRAAVMSPSVSDRGPSDAGGCSHRCCRGAWLCSVGASQTSGEPTDQVVLFTDDRRAASRPRLALRAAQPGMRQPARPQRAQPCGPHGCAVRPPSASGVWRLRINGAAIRDGLWFEYDPCGDSAGLDVGDRLVDLVERSRFADHAGLAGGVQLEHLA
jgi:hypothetical protein